MACDTWRRTPEQTETDRRREIQAALKRLEAKLRDKAVKLSIGPQGAVSFDGWADRDGVTDACAFRLLQSTGSWELKQALARAEVLAGRKVDMKAVASGTHAHGGVWHPGHKK